MSKLKKSTYGFIFAIITLLIALGIVLYLGLSGWFYSNTGKLTSDIQLGDTINMTLNGNETEAVSFTLAGSYLPNQNLKQYINVTNESETPLYIRAKAFIYDKNRGDCKVELGISEHWTESDEYYYFDEPLENSGKVSVASYVKLLTDQFYDSQKSYVLTIIVEGLDAKLDRQEIWGY